MVNVQGAVAPFASLLPVVTDGPADGALADTLEQVRQRIADRADGQSPPPLEVMLADFVRYHVAMAVIAAIAGGVLVGVSILLWRRFAASDRRARRVLGSFGAYTMVLALVVIMVAVANTSTAADPVPPFLDFFGGAR